MKTLELSLKMHKSEKELFASKSIFILYISNVIL